MKIKAEMSSTTLLIAALTATFTLSLVTGVSGSFLDSDNEAIVQFRLPRSTLAMLSGGFLGVAGALTQNLFRNPLASPSILGIEAGGSLAVTALLVAGLSLNLAPIAALAGCLVALMLVLTFRSNLILSGLAISTAAGSVGSLLLSIALNDPGRAVSVLQWLLGSLSGRGWSDLMRAGPFAAAGLFMSWRLGPALDTMMLGSQVATSVGVDVERKKLTAVTAVALLTAAAITGGGLLPFVGLIAPHLARSTGGYGAGSLKSNSIAAKSFCLGAILVMFADLIARTAAGPRELETGVITGVIGGPFFLWCLWRQQGKEART
jgi:iron complex transport system permease protein